MVPLAVQGVSVRLLTPEVVPHNLELYLNASWDEAAASSAQHLQASPAP